TLRDPHDVLATLDGRLIVADTGNNRVVELDSDGGWLSTFPSPAAARGPREQSRGRARLGWRLAVHLPPARRGSRRLATSGSPQRHAGRQRATAHLGHRPRPRGRAGAPRRAGPRGEAPPA